MFSTAQATKAQRVRMMRRSLPALLILLAGCAAPQPVAPLPDSYLALGSEPGWTLEITPARLNYSGDYGALRIDEPHGGFEQRTDGRGIASKRLAVTITPGRCSDGMSDRRFAESVVVVADGRRVQGCGGALLPPADLAGSLWRFSHIGGNPVADAARTELRFAAAQLSGSAGCNRFAGGYALTGDMLVVRQVVATEMACMGPQGAQEAALFALLGGPVTIRYGADGAMTLTGVDGATARLVLRP
jgi:heat shock protein HslJ